MCFDWTTKHKDLFCCVTQEENSHKLSQLAKYLKRQSIDMSLLKAALIFLTCLGSTLGHGKFGAVYLLFLISSKCQIDRIDRIELIFSKCCIEWIDRIK